MSARSAAQRRRSLRTSDPGLNLRVRGPCIALPVRAERAEPENAFHRVENLQAETRRPKARKLVSNRTHAHRFAFCPSALRVSGATDFFLASALSRSPAGLATSWWRRRAMRPTDFCHPYESCALAPRAFPARCRGLRRVEALRNLRFRRVDRGTGCFHDTRDRFGGSSFVHGTRALLPHGLETRAWAFSSHGERCDRASDTPVASSASPSRLARLRERCFLAARPLLGEVWRGSEGVETAETTVNAVS